jgi:phosphatidate cytidylyltransferase
MTMPRHVPIVTSPLGRRVLTSAVLIGLLLIVLLALPVAAAVVVLLAIVAAGAWEWSGFVTAHSRPWRYAFVAAVLVLLALAWEMTATLAGRRLFLGATLLWWCVACVWVVFAPQRVGTASAAFAGILALVPMGVALLRLRLIVPHGGAWTLYALVIVWAADTGGYFAGRRFGRFRLAPKVSPGKTWEGVLGALALGVPVALLGSVLFAVAALPLLLISIVAIAFSVVGDLTESMFKRHAGVKDSGWLIPGHGGVMDRIDSLTAAAPIFLFGLTFSGVAP